MSDTKLKPCPFCGGRASANYDSDGVTDYLGHERKWSIVCNNCCATTGLCCSGDKAMELWNTRVNK